MTITQLQALTPSERAQEIVASVRMSGNQLNNWFYASVECDELCFCTDCLGVARAN